VPNKDRFQAIHIYSKDVLGVQRAGTHLETGDSGKTNRRLCLVPLLYLLIIYEESLVLLRL
jgi:hypothetical protein